MYLCIHVERLNVGVCLISVHFFGCLPPSFYQFAVGCISTFNFIKSLKDMTTLGNFIVWWAFGVLGGLHCKKRMYGESIL